MRTTHPVRPHPRFAPSVEALEDRLVLTGYQPTPYEQLMLERLNDARANPTLYGQSIGLDLSSVASSQPLAFDPRIIQAARDHSTDMSNQNYFGHYDQQGHDPGYRMDAVGYPWTTFGESIAAGFNTPEDTLKALIIDQGEPDLGHRLQLLAMQPIYQVQTQVGVGIVLNGSGTYKNYYTIDTGVTADTRPFLTGVVYNDLNHNGKYDLNESVAGVAVNVAGVGSFAAFNTGGYSVQLSPGTYTVWFSGPGFTTSPMTVSLGSQNVRLNIDTSSLNTAALTAWVTQVGQDLLQRPLRQDEVSGLVSWMQAGQSKAGIVQALTHTPEYVQLDNQRWINDTEATVLGRTPGSAELAAWANYLQGGGTRANLVAMTLGAMYAGANNTTFLSALGQDVLGRTLASYEMNAWLTYMQQGASRQYVVAAFMGSTEYQRQDDARWVIEIGQVTLQRSLQAYEVNYFVNYLLAGNSRDAVLGMFFQSNEFQNLLPSH